VNEVAFFIPLDVSVINETWIRIGSWIYGLPFQTQQISHLKRLLRLLTTSGTN
jgi:hypothetical protein